MADLTDQPKLSAIMQKAAYNLGHDVEKFVSEKDQATRDYIDQHVSALSGQDAQFNAIVENLLRISDANKDTPDWDEGQNIYTLISNNYVVLLDKVEQNEQDVAALQQFATQTTQDMAAEFAATNKRIDDEIARSTAAQDDLQAQLNTLKTAHEQETAATDEEVAQIGSQIQSLQQSLTARQDEITSLQQALQASNARILTIENIIDGTTAESIVSEFRNGLNKQPSAFNHAIIPTA